MTVLLSISTGFGITIYHFDFLQIQLQQQIQGDIGKIEAK
jgi:hypothetical protein